jgi:hypothetical protein
MTAKPPARRDTGGFALSPIRAVCLGIVRVSNQWAGRVPWSDQERVALVQSAASRFKKHYATKMMVEAGGTLAP